MKNLKSGNFEIPFLECLEQSRTILYPNNAKLLADICFIKAQWRRETRKGLREQRSNRWNRNLQIVLHFGRFLSPTTVAGCCARFTTSWALSGHLNREDFHNGAAWRERAPARLSRGRPETVPSYRLWSSLDDSAEKGSRGEGRREKRQTDRPRTGAALLQCSPQQPVPAAEGGSVLIVT